MLSNYFSTNEIKPLNRADEWCQAIKTAYFPLQIHYQKPGHFKGELKGLTLGETSLSRLISEPASYERRPRHIRNSLEEEYLITIPKKSSVEFRQSGRDVSCDPGGFIIERGDEPYRFMYANPNDLFVMKVTKKTLSERIRQPDTLCARVFDGSSGIGGLFVTMVEQIQLASPNTSEATSTVLGRQLLELLALALDNNASAISSSVTAVRAAHIRRIEAYIRANLSNPSLTPESIAEACGISKRYLHNLFKDVNGTVSQTIRDLRLLAAHDILGVNSHHSIAEIAYRFGFSDQAQFSRLFKAYFGETPSGFKNRTTSH